ncbi:MAG: tetratricopeptide repeat protein [Candidatus Endonucleobacter bathymodioli]|uniref:Ancillary SecYEG translocon subunit n=1 Tax=Candidatus Endonucleibacter bathymodioli TaxID=539814 RepID=A0AA90NZ02_9GAMM|nr:tetratricopeptide repeat protein [Candidatus Endonucleobacter bathymodioli]
MSFDSDEEQVEHLKHLWKRYGQPALVAVMITLVGVFGYKAWQKNLYESSVDASKLYESLLEVLPKTSNELSDEDKATMNHVVESLQKDFSHSRYAALATLFLAKQQVKTKVLDRAINSFEWILSQKPDEKIEAITRIRLARVLIDLSDGKENQALEVLAKLKSDNKYFVGSIESVRGDIYLALGERDNAKKAYQKALDIADGQSRNLLQLKLDDLASMY